MERILPERTREVLGQRESTVLRPELVDTEPELVADEVPTEPALLRVLSLPDTLAVALKGSRSYKTELESLYLQTLSLVGTRHSFSPQLASTLSLIYGFPEGGPADKGADLGFSISQILATGGSLSASVSTDFSDTDSGAVDSTYSTQVSVQLTQPLLRGAGYEVSHESLVQGERNLVYAIRSFELFREDFAIDVARRYYRLVESKRTIENQKRNLEKFVFASKQAKALFDVGRQNEINFLRARRQELNSLNRLIEAEEGYTLSLDQFRIFLGLPGDQLIEIEDTAPTFVAVEYEVESSIEVALANRLDVLTRREQLEDVERSVRLAKDGLLPDLDLSLTYGSATRIESEFPAGPLDDHDLRASLNFAIPVDKLNERNAFRSAEIGLERARRSHEEFLDNIVVEIRSSIRELSRRRQSVDIQETLIGDEEKNVRIAELQFERGLADNRDVVDANESLLEAKNSLINEQVNYEIARLQLLRDLGILFIDDQGMWKE